MIYKITGRFVNTESAQSAAKRISDTLEDFYEIRFIYNIKDERFTSFNNVLYSAAATASLLPNGIPLHNVPDSVSFELDTDYPPERYSEISEECLLSVLTSEKSYEKVRMIMYNENGYDVVIQKIQN